MLQPSMYTSGRCERVSELTSVELWYTCIRLAHANEHQRRVWAKRIEVERHRKNAEESKCDELREVLYNAVQCRADGRHLKQALSLNVTSTPQQNIDLSRKAKLQLVEQIHEVQHSALSQSHLL